MKPLSHPKVAEFQSPSPSACHAVACAFSRAIRVLLVVWMSVNAFLLSSVDGGRAIPAPDIFSFSDRIEMPRVYAAPLSANVIEDKSIWNWTDKVFVRHAMDHVSFSSPATHPDFAVAIIVFGPSPEPARAMDLKILDQSLVDWLPAMSGLPFVYSLRHMTSKKTGGRAGRLEDQRELPSPEGAPKMSVPVPSGTDRIHQFQALSMREAA